MDKQYFDPNKDGFYGAYYPNKEKSEYAIIAMLGDSSDDHMAVSGVKWLHKLGCNVLTMSPDKQDYGHHNYPLERFDHAIRFLKAQGNRKIGIAGASTTGMLALVAASYFHDISLTLAMCPCDFIMEGFYQDGKDGAHERPGDHESSVSWQGNPLPYLPYAYRHPEYWQKIKEESRESGDKIASRKMFMESERIHPVQECEKIKIENIHGKVICVGAEDDALWETAKYIRRMEERLKVLPHKCDFEAIIYEHGTHFVFPQSLLDIMLPGLSGLLVRFMFKAAKDYPKECKQTRMDIDHKLKNAIINWII